MRATNLILTGTLAGVLLLAASSAAAPADCDGIPLVGTPQEIAATPRDDVVLELMALHMSGGLTADQAVYDRVKADVERVFALVPEMAHVPFHPRRHDGRGILFLVDQPTWNAMQGGTYTAWDCLNDYYGLESLRLSSGLRSGTLMLKGIYDTALLLPLYAQLPGFTSVEVNAFGGDGPTICGLIDSSATHHYFFDDRGGDCPAGCTTSDIRYLTTSPGGAPQLRGRWVVGGGEPRPQWYELYEHCLSVPGPLPAAIPVLDTIGLGILTALVLGVARVMLRRTRMDRAGLQPYSGGS